MKLQVAMMGSLGLHLLILLVLVPRSCEQNVQWGEGEEVIMVSLSPGMTEPTYLVDQGKLGIKTNPKTPAGGIGSGYEEGTESEPTILAKIRQRILQAKFYPPVARKRGLEGAVTVNFEIAPDGSLQTSSVLNSSGHAILDEEALKTLSRAAPYPFYEGIIHMKLDYQLRNQ